MQIENYKGMEGFIQVNKMFIYAREDQKQEIESLGHRYVYELIQNGIKYYVYNMVGDMNFDKKDYIVSKNMYFQIIKKGNL